MHKGSLPGFEWKAKNKHVQSFPTFGCQLIKRRYGFVAVYAC
jgi:hypothetical protein